MRATFDRLREVIEACGPVEMIPQKTTYTHSYRAGDAAFFDASFAALVRESYIRGRQEHRSG